MQRFTAVLLAGAVLALAACATVQQYEAAGDVRAFLLSIRDTRPLSTPTSTGRL